jgi:hypothetical protein
MGVREDNLIAIEDLQAELGPPQTEQEIFSYNVGKYKAEQDVTLGGLSISGDPSTIYLIPFSQGYDRYDEEWPEEFGFFHYSPDPSMEGLFLEAAKELAQGEGGDIPLRIGNGYRWTLDDYDLDFFELGYRVESEKIADRLQQANYGYHIPSTDGEADAYQSPDQYLENRRNGIEFDWNLPPEVPDRFKMPNAPSTTEEDMYLEGYDVGLLRTAMDLADQNALDLWIDEVNANAEGDFLYLPLKIVPSSYEEVVNNTNDGRHKHRVIISPIEQRNIYQSYGFPVEQPNRWTNQFISAHTQSLKKPINRNTSKFLYERDADGNPDYKYFDNLNDARSYYEGRPELFGDYQRILVIGDLEGSLDYQFDSGVSDFENWDRDAVLQAWSWFGNRNYYQTSPSTSHPALNLIDDLMEIASQRASQPERERGLIPVQAREGTAGEETYDPATRLRARGEFDVDQTRPVSADEMEDLLDELRELGVDISSDDDLAGLGIKKDRKGLWLVGGAVLASLLIRR